MQNCSTFLLSCIILLSGCGKDDSHNLRDTPPDVKLYGVKNAFVEYEYSADAAGKKKQYIANYGKYQREEDRFTVRAGESVTTIASLTIRCDTIQYTIDMRKKQGLSTPWDISEARKLAATLSESQLENISGEILMRMGATNEGKENILELPCDVYDLMGKMRMSLWKGIVMRSVTKMGKMTMTMTATLIDTNFVDDPDLFLPPKDVTLKSSSERQVRPGMLP